MRIAIGNDHTAVDLKNTIVDYLTELGYDVINLGTDSRESCDYPVYGEKVGRAVADGQADLGIAICGTGVGISLAANKVKGVRACVCSEPYTAKLSRMHNNSPSITHGAYSESATFLKACMSGQSGSRRIGFPLRPKSSTWLS